MTSHWGEYRKTDCGLLTKIYSDTFRGKHQHSLLRRSTANEQNTERRYLFDEVYKIHWRETFGLENIRLERDGRIPFR